MIKCRKQGNLTQLESFLWRIHRNHTKVSRNSHGPTVLLVSKTTWGNRQGFLLASKRFYSFGDIVLIPRSCSQYQAQLRMLGDKKSKAMRPLLSDIQSIGKAGKAPRWRRPEMEVGHGSEQGLQEVLGEKTLQSARADTSPSTRNGASRERKSRL